MVPKSITPPGSSSQKYVSCIGDEEIILGGRDGGVFLVPTSPSITIPITLQLADCQVHIPGRFSLEERVKAVIARSIAAVMDEKEEVKIISRSLKIGEGYSWWRCFEAR